MEYKKSYRGFILFFILFCIALIAVPILFASDEKISVCITMNICSIGMAICNYIIYKTEKIYWFTGVEFEQAFRAGSERRKKYVKKHLRYFGIFALAFFRLD